MCQTDIFYERADVISFFFFFFGGGGVDKHYHLCIHYGTHKSRRVTQKSSHTHYMGVYYNRYLIDRS